MMEQRAPADLARFASCFLAPYTSRIVAVLAQMPEEQRQQIIAAARARERENSQGRRDMALRMAHVQILPDLKAFPAAIEIEKAVRGQRGIRSDTEAARKAVTQRSAIRRFLLSELGSLDGIPKAERIRQIIADE
jgi:hypothetical protein